MLVKLKREIIYWKILLIVIFIYNLCGFSIYSKCIGIVFFISSEDNVLLFFVVFVFFKVGVYFRISFVLAMYGIV